MHLFRKQNFSKVIQRIQSYKPYAQKAPDCYFDLPQIEQRNSLHYSFQKNLYKSVIPNEKVYCDDYDDPNAKRLEGCLYEGSILASLDHSCMEFNNHWNDQCFCDSKVSNLTIVSLNVGADLINNQWRIKGNMIEELLVRSDADFICLQNVHNEIFKQWLMSQTLIRYYAFSYDKQNHYSGNLIISKWPSYVYDVPLSETSNKTLTVLEAINGINGQPFLICNANLEQGALKKKERMHELFVALNTIQDIPCDNIIITRNFDFFANEEEKQLLKTHGYHDITQDKDILYEKLNVFSMRKGKSTSWKFDEVLAFGQCASPSYWRTETAGLSVFDEQNRLSPEELGVLCTFDFINKRGTGSSSKKSI